MTEEQTTPSAEPRSAILDGLRSNLANHVTTEQEKAQGIGADAGRVIKILGNEDTATPLQDTAAQSANQTKAGNQ